MTTEQQIATATWANVRSNRFSDRRREETSMRFLSSQIFGDLVRLSMETLRDYHSDFFWDAYFINDKVQLMRESMMEHLEFYYSVRQSGTYHNRLLGPLLERQYSAVYRVRIEMRYLGVSDYIVDVKYTIDRME